MRYPARQSLEACEAIARLHQISPERAVYLQQSPEAIDAGVFHNDVISVGHVNVLMYHELAFAEGERAIEKIKQSCDHDLAVIQVRVEEVPLNLAVRTYLFNSQIVTLPDGKMMLIAPQECAEMVATAQWVERLIAATDNPIAAVKYLNLRESMRNGGGPACLRQRVTLSEKEREAVRGNVMLDNELSVKLEDWVKRHYRERLEFADLADPQLSVECRTALAELTSLLRLGALYPFQR